MLVYKKGDVTTAHEDIIAHGCNARGVMGKGVAKAIRDKWPGAYEAYKAAYDEHGLHLGEVVIYQGDTVTVANCITQEFYRGGDDNTQYVDYDAVHKCMGALRRYCEEQDLHTIAMPKIGAGLGGGDWLRIEGIIRYEFEETDIKISVYEL